MRSVRRIFYIFLIILSLSACNVQLYSGLAQSEANQMLALLMLHHINAEKQQNKDGTVTVNVDRKHFIDAVELLRQNGFPRRNYVTVDKIFPSNQLVTSPGQEQAKMVYIKEQQLESMLSHMEGVIRVDVSIAVAAPSNDKNMNPSSASVFMKYSPEINLEIYQSQIKNLIHDAIPGIDYSKISILMQPANFRFTPKKITEADNLQKQEQSHSALEWLLEHIKAIQMILVGLAGVVAILSVVGWIRYLRK